MAAILGLITLFVLVDGCIAFHASNYLSLRTMPSISSCSSTRRGRPVAFHGFVMGTAGPIARADEIKKYFVPIFQMYDKDKDGLIDKLELMIVDKNPDGSEADIQLSEFDKNKDGKLNMDEAIFSSLRAYFLSSDWYKFKVMHLKLGALIRTLNLMFDGVQDQHLRISASDTARLVRMDDVQLLTDLLGGMNALQYAHFRASVTEFVARNVEFLARTRDAEVNP